jgi:hypothetical protein
MAWRDAIEREREGAQALRLRANQTSAAASGRKAAAAIADQLESVTIRI